MTIIVLRTFILMLHLLISFSASTKCGLNCNSTNKDPAAYRFAYFFKLKGASLRREEKSDTAGRVSGYYTIRNDNGTYRTVEYISDNMGFRAKVVTNDPNGWNSSFPLNIRKRGKSGEQLLVHLQSSGKVVNNATRIENTTKHINLTKNTTLINRTSSGSAIAVSIVASDRSVNETPSDAESSSESIFELASASNASTNNTACTFMNNGSHLQSTPAIRSNITLNNETEHLTSDSPNMSNSSEITSIFLSTFSSLKNSATESGERKNSTTPVPINATSNLMIANGIQSSPRTHINAPVDDSPPIDPSIPGGHRYRYHFDFGGGKLFKQKLFDEREQIIDSFGFARDSDFTKMEEKESQSGKQSTTNFLLPF